MIEKKQYGLCLVDIRTPKMNGKRALSVARKEISTTVLPGDIHYWGCYGWGYLGFHRAVWQAVFTKPFTPDELIAMIKEVLKPSLITE